MEPSCCAPVTPVIREKQPAAPVVTAPTPVELEIDVKPITPGSGDVLLFKTPTCPNCKTAQALLDRAGVHYETVNANEAKDLVARYDIKQAPTLVLQGAEGYEKFRGVSDIKGWLMHRQ